MTLISHNPVQLQYEHRSGLTSFLKDIVFILIIYCNCIRLIVHKMASKKQENFEDQDQLGPDHGKVQKNVTSNHPQKICGKCKKLFSTWSNLKKHLLKTHNVKPFTWCHLCNLELNSARELKKHFIDIHTISKPKRIDNIQICDQCGKRFSRKWTLNQHSKNVHGGENAILYNCEFWQNILRGCKKIP